MLVGTGEFDERELAAGPQPDYVLDSVRELLGLM